MAKMDTVSLSDAERLVLTETARASAAPNRLAPRARILLVADQGEAGPGWKDTVIAEAFAVSVPTVERLRKRAATEGVEAALEERRHRSAPGKLDGAQEARLTALACTKPPNWHARSHPRGGYAGPGTCWLRRSGHRRAVPGSHRRRCAAL